MEYPIDFVIPWVDGNDPAWRAEKAKYNPEAGTDSSETRYRDWDNLQYWFRGVEKFTPWVNKIHFVTWGHLPPWLNTAHPKLHIVKHEDYIPAEYLPVFSSHPIELNLHRIVGLCEHFVYFNDDFFVIRPSSPEMFFRKGLPVETVGESLIFPAGKSELMMKSIHVQNMAILNEHFPKKETLKRIGRRWFSPANRVFLARSVACLLLSPSVFTGISKDHLPSSFLKSVYEEIWRLEPEVLEATSRNRFRGIGDVNQYLVKYWQVLSGRFVPVSVRGRYFDTGKQMEALFNYVHGQKGNLVCCNDEGIDQMGEDAFIQMREQLKQAFDTILPEKSSFEV